MTEPASTAVGGLALYKLGAFGLAAALAKRRGFFVSARRP